MSAEFQFQFQFQSGGDGNMETATKYGVDNLAADLRRITRQTSDDRKIVAQVRPLAKRMAASADSWVLPDYYHCDAEQGFGVHLLHEEENHDLAIFAVSWLPGRGTPPHDHGAWAVVSGVDGGETNINWKRLDDGSKPGYAEIKEFHRVTIGPGDVMVMLPRDIHTVINETGEVTLSLHIYGRHVNYTERSQFDPENNTTDELKLKVE